MQKCKPLRTSLELSTATHPEALAHASIRRKMEPVDDLIHTLEVVRDAVWAKDGHKGFEAVTVFLLQFMDLFGHAPDVVSRTFPTLEKLKGAIQTEHFEDAEPVVLALLARMRGVNKSMKSQDGLTGG